MDDIATDFRGFWPSKRASSAEECEDAFAADRTSGRFALAAGAAKSVLAGSWAQSLAAKLVGRSLKGREAGVEPWRELELLLTSPASNERFASWIEELRDTGRLRNDDVMLLGINL